MDDLAYPVNGSSRKSPSMLGIPVEIAFAIFALLVAVNLAYLDILIIHLLNKTNEAPNVAVQSVTSLQKDLSCPQSCLSAMQNLSTTSAQSITTTNAPQTAVSPPRVQASAVREFFVPFGSGSGAATDWTDITGLAATIDTTNYTRMKSVVFETTVRIPTGNQTASVRLFNVTDKHPVWFSDISVEGGVTQLAVSPAVTLDLGNKTYQVQLKTSLGSETFIDQARLHIVTN